jgi:sulfonate transport system substrate-binding protein
MSRSGTAKQSGRRAGLFAATLVVVGLVLGALPAHAASDDKDKKLDLSGITLKVGYGVVRDSSTQDVRLASGAFENTPYEIKWVPFQTGGLEALIAGAVDVYPDQMWLGIVLAQAGAKTPWTRETAPISVIGASVAPPEAGAVIGVHPGSGIKKVKDLKGKKVAYVRGGVSQLWWEIAAREAKLKDGDVDEVQLPVAETRAAFLSGAVDALVGQHRTLIPLESSGDAVIIAKSNGAAPEYRFTAVRAGYMDDKKQAAAVADFLKRLQQSKRWLLNHPKDGEAVYAKSASVGPEDAKLAIAEFPSTILPLDDELAKKLQEQTKLFFDVGVTPTNPKASILFDKRYAVDAPATTE